MAGVFEGDGGEIGQRFEQLQIARIKTVGTDAIDQLDYAETSVAKLDGNRDDRLRLHLGFFVDLAKEACVFGSIRDDHGLAMLRNPSGDALPDLDANIFESLRGLAHRQFKIKFLRGLIEKQQRPVIRPQKLVDFFHDGAENLIELQRGRQRLAKFLKDRDFAGFSLFVGNRRVAAAFHGGELFDFLHVRLDLTYRE
ncbi:MAG TPA: hypothetical protein VN281_20585 [Verrucomicrobiae bacterium]|nr:hypothetical protein [Verrucomicrobiae bacterium]